ncbi:MULTISPECIES: hypothetical protein [unclassified Streptomyces]|uniref:hypothetical protein n=1 Tax=unclassified Streptomyces TaxID=2593676 RepID=UPI002E7FEECD|nr:hypothetical protein [Streptomyces sp. NBC_00589]WTI42332.1 hypothetical protein OIC96_49275 [Streptomyces sp. NBC_00775]WUB23986.1 hypothetical protein OHA51_00455 [Streptomyces sp. NBC_00589]
MNAENAGDPKSAVARLGASLKSLYDEAKRARGESLTREQIRRRLAIPTSTLDDWLKGKSAPSDQNLPKYRELIAYLEERVGRPRLRHAGWERLISLARAESDSNPGGRPSRAPRLSRVAPSRYCHDAEWYRPQVLTGREAELNQLQELIRTGLGYLVLVAPPWAGKTAFLATFATSCTADDIDLVAYFVRCRHGTDNADAFLKAMVSQLSQHVGRPPGRADRAALLALYEEAARTSTAGGRNLLLIVDGLDEDARAHIGGGPSIASLLPPQPYPGLRVLISRRWHPPLPGDVPRDHPVRGAEQIPGFRPSPQAGVLRSTALNDLATLLGDSREWAREIIGFLALANGGLSERDLIKLVELGGHGPVPIPFQLQELFCSVVGRVLGPEDLEPDTFVLAHEELYGAVTDGLGPEKLTELTQRLHAWADRYRADGWPESTPTYLLHHYQELLRSTSDHDRFTAFALDHRRLLRLTDRGRPDVALASLDDVMQATPTPAVLASAAASRSLLTAQNPLVPREVLRILSVAGDVPRARSLALAPTDPASKAVRVLELVQALLTVKTQKAADQAAGLAREAAAWAERARQQNPVTIPAEELDTEAIVSRAAVALAATGQPEPAIQMLTTVDICRPDHVTAVAEAAALLLEPDPAFAGWLLDELASEAEHQAESAEGSPAFAIRIWAAIAKADPGRAGPARRRMKEFSQGLDEESAGQAAADGSALTDPALAEALPEEVRKLTNPSGRGVRNAPQSELCETPTRVGQELLAVGEAPDKVRTLLAEVKEDEQLLNEMKRLSALGDSAQLRRCLDQFMRTTAKQSPAAVWLPFLSQALSSASENVDNGLLSRLEGDFSDTPLHIRVLTSAALAHADAGRRDKALRCVEKAAGIAERMTAPQPLESLIIAQAFAHVGDFEQTTRWAPPPRGGKPTGKSGILYRRSTLAVEMGLNPKFAVTRTLADNPSRIGLSASGTDLLGVLSRRAAGERTDAQMTSLETTARARLDTDPLIATGLSLLHAMLGDTERACDMAAELQDPEARGVAQATLAAYLAGIPAHLDLTVDEDLWTLSVLRVLAHHVYPARPGHDAAVQNLVIEVLSTGSWFWALPVLGREIPGTVHRVVNVLDQHQRVRQARW